jgi:hypothetical protein
MIKVGDRLIVQGIMHAKAIVTEIVYLPKEDRHEIRLSWGEHGTSKVYSSDQDKVWYKYQACN